MRIRAIVIAVALAFALAEGYEMTEFLNAAGAGEPHQKSFVTMLSDHSQPHTHFEELNESVASVTSPLSASGAAQERDVYTLQLRPVFSDRDGRNVLAAVDMIGTPRFSMSTQRMYRRCSVKDALVMLRTECGFIGKARAKVWANLQRGETNEIGGHEIFATRLFNEDTLLAYGLTFGSA
jgi:hypothetical protein